MYKSPIELIYQGTEMQIERGILRAVHKQDINVDRAELIRALQYDRSQYEKGYQDGMAAMRVTARWIGERGDYLCSNCGAEAPNDGYYPAPYCYECGAMMNGGNANG